jgi:probable rRNA maturation factor
MDALVELSIDLGDEESDHAFQQQLSSLALETVVNQTLHQAGITQPVTLTLLITNDETIQALNQQYRQQDKPTDVLSFPLLDIPLANAPADQLWIPPEEAGGPASKHIFITPSELTTELTTNIGDIVISWPTVLRQAAETGHSPTYELLYLLSHGVLHLVGYDDQTEAGYQAMIQIQQAVMEATGGKASSHE